MFEQLEKLEKRYEELTGLLAAPDAVSSRDLYNKYAKELSDITPAVSGFREYKKISAEILGLQDLVKARHGQDKDFLDLARKELEDLGQRQLLLEQRIKEILEGEDEEFNKDVIVEIRQGTGGMEAGLFAADLYRMYTQYAAGKGWAIELLAAHPTELGGFKEVVFSIKGKDAYKRIRFESGVHRVQRVPSTEAQGRIHTSTATVAIMIEPEEVELVVDPNDLRIDTYRSSGPGGQHMQKSDSAVRITHIPTGLVVACQDERSQLKNKTKALRILRARLLDARQQEEAKKISLARKSQIGSGDRSEKIRTYNFPDRRVTDHRINFTLHQLEAVLNGDLDGMLDALIKAARG